MNLSCIYIFHIKLITFSYKSKPPDFTNEKEIEKTLFSFRLKSSKIPLFPSVTWEIIYLFCHIRQLKNITFTTGDNEDILNDVFCSCLHMSWDKHQNPVSCYIKEMTSWSSVFILNAITSGGRFSHMLAKTLSKKKKEEEKNKPNKQTKKPVKPIIKALKGLYSSSDVGKSGLMLTCC